MTDKDKQALIEMVTLLAGLANPIIGAVIQFIRISQDLSEETRAELMTRIEQAQANVPEWK